MPMANSILELPGGGGSLGIALSGLPSPMAWWHLFTGDWKGFLRLWLDPFDLWFSRIFAGRPKVGVHSATDSIALFLIPSADPVLALWGIGIRLMEGRGFPLSTGNPQAIAEYRRLAEAVRLDLVRQFGAADGAQKWRQIAQLVLHCHNPASNRECIANRVRLLDQPYNLAIARGLLDPKTGFPFPPPAPKCEPGFHLEAGKCVRNPPVPPRGDCCR